MLRLFVAFRLECKAELSSMLNSIVIRGDDGKDNESRISEGP